MAWISVWQQVEGKKLRSFSKSVGCSLKEALGILVSFWLWGLDNADEHGLITAADRNDIIDVISIGLSAGLSGEKVVECLILHHWIDEKPEGLYIHDWKQWQKQWYSALERREYDKDRKRKEREEKRAKASPLECPQEIQVQPSPSPSVVDVVVGDVFRSFQENIGPISPHQASVINSYIDDGLSPTLIIEAIKDSLGADNKWKYLCRILDNSLEQKVFTADQYTSKKIEFSNKSRPKAKPVAGQSNFTGEE